MNRATEKNRSTPMRGTIFGLSVIALFWTTTDAVSTELDSRSVEDIRKEIATLEEHIEYRESRLVELTNDMLSLDARVEQRIGRILDSITKVTDSEDSQTKVARVKQEAIEALRKCGQHYQTRRKSLKLETLKRNPTVTREDLFEDIERFEDRVDGRLDQIVTVINSMQGHKDYERWRGYEGYGLWRNERYYQNRKETAYTEKERKEFMEEIEADIDAIDLRNREIRRILGFEITPEYRKMLTDEMGTNLAIMERREAYLEKVASSNSPPTNPVGLAQAMNLGTVVRSMADDMDRDCRSIWQKYSEINSQRGSLKELRERLVVNSALLKKESLETPDSER